MDERLQLEVPFRFRHLLVLRKVERARRPDIAKPPDCYAFRIRSRLLLFARRHWHKITLPLACHQSVGECDELRRDLRAGSSETSAARHALFGPVTGVQAQLGQTGLPQRP